MFIKPRRGMVINFAGDKYVVLKARPLLLRNLKTNENLKLNTSQWKMIIGLRPNWK